MTESSETGVGVVPFSIDSPGCLALIWAELARLELENGFFLANDLARLKSLVTRLEAHLKATF